MQRFGTILKKPDEKGRMTVVELPFNAAEVFNVKKETIKVHGTINGQKYRNKLISRGRGKYVMAVDRELQFQIGFEGNEMEAEVSMDLDCSAMYGSGNRADVEELPCNIDVLTAIKTRRSIRLFSSAGVEKNKIEKIIEAGFCAPNAKGKRPWHFLVSTDKGFIMKLADDNNYRSLLTAGCCIIVCGDRNMEGITELLLEDCAAAAENILLAAHGLGLGSTWCTIFKRCHRFKLISDYFGLPDKIIPVAILALGYPDEERDCTPRYDGTKVHWEEW